MFRFFFLLFFFLTPTVVIEIKVAWKARVCLTFIRFKEELQAKWIFLFNIRTN